MSKLGWKPTKLTTVKQRKNRYENSLKQLIKINVIAILLYGPKYVALYDGRQGRCGLVSCYNSIMICN